MSKAKTVSLILSPDVRDVLVAPYGPGTQLERIDCDDAQQAAIRILRMQDPYFLYWLRTDGLSTIARQLGIDIDDHPPTLSPEERFRAFERALAEPTVAVAPVIRYERAEPIT